MSMTYGTDAIVPDSANTGSAWATGNKTYQRRELPHRRHRLQVAFQRPEQRRQPAVHPRQPAHRKSLAVPEAPYGYRTGIVTTAAVTDATPAVEGSYTGYRQARLEIARQYRENPMLPAPGVRRNSRRRHGSVHAAGRTDRRDLIARISKPGLSYVTTASELRDVGYGQPTIGLFKGSRRARSLQQRHRHGVRREHGRGVRQAGLAASRLRTRRNLGASPTSRCST